MLGRFPGTTIHTRTKHKTTPHTTKTNIKNLTKKALTTHHTTSPTKPKHPTNSYHIGRGGAHRHIPGFA